MNRRPGITLLEVLASIFITGIGLLALLVLFPLGALEMARSIRDDRTGHVKHNAAAVFNGYDARNQQSVRDGMLDPSGAVTGGGYGGGLTPFYLAGSYPPGVVDPNVGAYPSYPVIVDPVGFNFTPPGYRKNWVAGMAPGSPGAPGTVPRRVSFDPMSAPPPGESLASHTKHWMSLLDDIRFMDHGVPTPGIAPNPTAPVERTYGFSWAYLCKMPKASSGVVEMSVIVYRSRPLDGDATSGEAAYLATFDTTNNTILVTFPAGQVPDIVANGWVMDATMNPLDPSLGNPPGTSPEPRGYFYRVLNVTQLNATTLEVEVQQPLKAGGNGVLVFMENVIGVFERGTY